MDDWVSIGLHGYYVNSVGDVKSVARLISSGKGRKMMTKTRIIKTCVSNSGYRFVSLTSKHKRFYIHRLVAEFFIRKSKKGEQVNHKDGNKFNNSLDNLEVVTCSENRRHSYRVLGNKVWNIKLTRDKADEIRVLYGNGEVFSQKGLAKMYGVSVMVVNRIINYKQLEYK